MILAQGVPMILMGDEYGHTKDGNNNTYCHDSKWNYVDWDQARTDPNGLLRFWMCLIRMRRMRPELGQPQYLQSEVCFVRQPFRSGLQE
jgi:isoamylase